MKRVDKDLNSETANCYGALKTSVTFKRYLFTTVCIIFDTILMFSSKNLRTNIDDIGYLLKATTHYNFRPL